MNKILYVIMLSVSSLFFCGSLCAENPIKIIVDGKTVSTDVHPVMRNASIYVPLRGVLERINAQVSYDNSTGYVTAARKGMTVVMKVNSPQAKVNGNTVIMPVQAFYLQGRTMVPLRFLSENLGCSVRYEAQRGIVFINSGGMGTGSSGSDSDDVDASSSIPDIEDF